MLLTQTLIIRIFIFKFVNKLFCSNGPIIKIASCNKEMLTSFCVPKFVDHRCRSNAWGFHRTLAHRPSLLSPEPIFYYFSEIILIRFFTYLQELRNFLLQYIHLLASTAWQYWVPHLWTCSCQKYRAFELSEPENHQIQVNGVEWMNKPVHQASSWQPVGCRTSVFVFGNIDEFVISSTRI